MSSSGQLLYNDQSQGITCLVNGGNVGKSDRGRVAGVQVFGERMGMKTISGRHETGDHKAKKTGTQVP
jgi:hypothetical protein